MDLIIKNLERLKNYTDGNHRPIERVVVDFDKLATEDFTQIFFDACEKYDDKAEEDLPLCTRCKYQFVEEDKDPCRSCLDSACRKLNWEPAEPTLKEVTERMQSEFDATGKDVKIFMNERVIKR